MEEVSRGLVFLQRPMRRACARRGVAGRDDRLPLRVAFDDRRHARRARRIRPRDHCSGARAEVSARAAARGPGYDYLGTFTTSGALVVADPAYVGSKRAPGAFSLAVRVKGLEGLWYVFARNGEGDLSDRTGELVAIHTPTGSTPTRPNCSHDRRRLPRAPGSGTRHVPSAIATRPSMRACRAGSARWRIPASATACIPSTRARSAASS